MEARASNPGRIRIQPLRWFASDPIINLIIVAPATGLVVLAVFVHWSFGILAAPAVWWYFFVFWKRQRDQFMEGDRLAAKVVGLDPTLVATFADLTMGEGFYPSIKIFKTKLTKFGGKPATVGLAGQPGVDLGVRLT